MKSEQNRRNEPRKSSSDWGAADKRAYKAALKKYNDFISKGSNNLTKEEYDKKAKELKEKMELAKKEYDSRKPGSDKDSEKAQKAAAKAEAARAKEEAAEERRKQTKEKVGQELAELQRKNDEEEINTMQEGLEKKLRQIENDYQAQKNEINKQETAWKRDNKKAGIATGTNGLTTEQTDAINEAHALNEKSRTKAIEEANKEALKDELLAMTDYLKEYGTIQEQKYAIAKEYAEKIKEVNEGAGTADEKQWKVKALEKQRDTAMSQVDAKSLALDIDWGTTFEGVGNVLKDVAKETLGKVETYMKTAEFKALSAENKKTYTDLQAKLKQETSRYGVQSPRMSRHTKKACEISKTRRMPTQGRSMNWKRRKQTWLLLLMTPQRKLPRKRLILHKERSMPLPLSKRRHRMKATRHARRSRTTPMQQRKAFRTSPTI